MTDDEEIKNIIKGETGPITAMKVLEDKPVSLLPSEDALSSSSFTENVSGSGGGGGGRGRGKVKCYGVGSVHEITKGELETFTEYVKRKKVAFEGVRAAAAAMKRVSEGLTYDPFLIKYNMSNNIGKATKVDNNSLKEFIFDIFIKEQPRFLHGYPSFVLYQYNKSDWGNLAHDKSEEEVSDLNNTLQLFINIFQGNSTLEPSRKFDGKSVADLKILGINKCIEELIKIYDIKDISNISQDVLENIIDTTLIYIDTEYNKLQLILSKYLFKKGYGIQVSPIESTQVSKAVADAEGKDGVEEKNQAIQAVEAAIADQGKAVAALIDAEQQAVEALIDAEQQAVEAPIDAEQQAKFELEAIARQQQQQQQLEHVEEDGDTCNTAQFVPMNGDCPYKPLLPNQYFGDRAINFRHALIDKFGIKCFCESFNNYTLFNVWIADTSKGYYNRTKTDLGVYQLANRQYYIFCKSDCELFKDISTLDDKSAIFLDSFDIDTFFSLGPVQKDKTINKINFSSDHFRLNIVQVNPSNADKIEIENNKKLYESCERHTKLQLTAGNGSCFFNTIIPQVFTKLADMCYNKNEQFLALQQTLSEESNNGMKATGDNGWIKAEWLEDKKDGVHLKNLEVDHLQKLNKYSGCNPELNPILFVIQKIIDFYAANSLLENLPACKKHIQDLLRDKQINGDGILNDNDDLTNPDSNLHLRCIRYLRNYMCRQKLIGILELGHFYKSCYDPEHEQVISKAQVDSRDTVYTLFTKVEQWSLDTDSGLNEKKFVDKFDHMDNETFTKHNFISIDHVKYMTKYFNMKIGVFVESSTAEDQRGKILIYSESGDVRTAEYNDLDCDIFVFQKNAHFDIVYPLGHAELSEATGQLEHIEEDLQFRMFDSPY